MENVNVMENVNKKRSTIPRLQELQSGLRCAPLLVPYCPTGQAVGA